MKESGTFKEYSTLDDRNELTRAICEFFELDASQVFYPVLIPSRARVADIGILLGDHDNGKSISIKPCIYRDEDGCTPFLRVTICETGSEEGDQ